MLLGFMTSSKNKYVDTVFKSPHFMEAKNKTKPEKKGTITPIGAKIRYTSDLSTPQLFQFGIATFIYIAFIPRDPAYIVYYHPVHLSIPKFADPNPNPTSKQR